MQIRPLLDKYESNTTRNTKELALIKKSIEKSFNIPMEVINSDSTPLTCQEVKLMIAKSGRWSCKEPNESNIPKEEK